MLVKQFKRASFGNQDTEKLQANTRELADQVLSYIFKMKFQKPGFKFVSGADNKTIRVEATSTAPKFFKIGNEILTLETNLNCSFARNGENGLQTGLTIAASTFYYVYAIRGTNGVALLADVQPPTQGPAGFQDWTYLGALNTESGSAIIANFVSYNGRYQQTDVRVEQVSHTGDTNVTAKTIRMPQTAKYVIGMAAYGGAAAAGDNGFITGSSAANDTYPIAGLVNSLDHFGYMEIPLQTYNTIFLRTDNGANAVYWRSTGWIEDPTEYK